MHLYLAAVRFRWRSELLAAEQTHSDREGKKGNDFRLTGFSGEIQAFSFLNFVAAQLDHRHAISSA